MEDRNLQYEVRLARKPVTLRTPSVIHFGLQGRARYDIGGVAGGQHQACRSVGDCHHHLQVRVHPPAIVDLDIYTVVNGRCGEFVPTPLLPSFKTELKVRKSMSEVVV